VTKSQDFPKIEIRPQGSIFFFGFADAEVEICHIPGSEILASIGKADFREGKRSAAVGGTAAVERIERLRSPIVS